MTKKEREEKLKLALKMYTTEKVSIIELEERLAISRVTISTYFKENGILIINRHDNRPSLLSTALLELNTLSVKEVSNKYGINEEVLLLSKEGLNKSKLKQKIIDLAIEEYINTPYYNKSVAKISTKYGINKKTLKKYLAIRGIETPSTGSAVEFRRDAFDCIDTEEKAYWLGFMYADGYIESKRYGFGLGVSIKDIDHLKKFNDFLKYPKGMSIVESHQFGSKDKHNKNGEIMYMVNTHITDKHVWEALKLKGCVPNKSLILKFPDESMFTTKKLIYDFIRGYVDGDGTLGVYPHSKTNPKLEESLLIVGTKSFLEGILKYLGDGFLMQKPNCNEKTYRLGYSTKKAHIAADLLYKNANIYLERKYNIYINKFAALKSGKNGEG